MSLRRTSIASCCWNSSRGGGQFEGVFAVEGYAIVRLGRGQLHQHALAAIARLGTLGGTPAHPFLYLVAEVLKQHLPRAHHRPADLDRQVELELLEGRADAFDGAAG
jgi:hypothetical protein